MHVQFLNGDLSDLQDLLVGQNIMVVEEKQKQHLIGRSLEFVTLLHSEVASQLCGT